MFVAVGDPQPTQPPDAREVQYRLQRRQNLDQTCGWVNGDTSMWSEVLASINLMADTRTDTPATCAPGFSCAVNTDYRAHYCCASIPCNLPTTCYPLLSCDSSCQSDSLALTWLVVVITF
jgi:hypothetical protein